MKLTEGWVLTDFADEFVAVPVGENAEAFKGVVRLNETGKEIWNGLAAGLDREQIADRLLEDYEGVDRETAIASIDKVVSKLRAEGLLAD